MSTYAIERIPRGRDESLMRQSGGPTLACEVSATIVQSVLVDGESQPKVAARVSVHQSTVSRIVARFKHDVLFTLGRPLDHMERNDRIDIIRRLLGNAAQARQLAA